MSTTTDALTGRTAQGLAGFFAGVAWLFVVPGVSVSIGRAVWPEGQTPGLIFTALVTLGVPIAGLFVHRTARLSRYMLLGMAVALAIVVGIAAVFYVLMLNSDGV